jgi:hypothetical protein
VHTPFSHVLVWPNGLHIKRLAAGYPEVTKHNTTHFYSLFQVSMLATTFKLVHIPADGHIKPSDFEMVQTPTTKRTRTRECTIDTSKFLWAKNRPDIKTVVLPNLVERIPAESFDFYCHNSTGAVAGTHIVFPPHLKVIESSAFNNWFKLQELVLPETVAEIDSFAFGSTHEPGEGCNLKRVVMLGWRNHKPYSRIYHPKMFHPKINDDRQPLVLHEITRVDAPNSAVRMLGGVCKGYHKYKDLPTPVRMAGRTATDCYYWPSQVGGPLQAMTYYFWNVTTHATSCTPEAKATVRTVLLVCEHLNCLAHASLSESESESESGNRFDPMHLPLETWHHILSFIAKFDLKSHQIN